MFTQKRLVTALGCFAGAAMTLSACMAGTDVDVTEASLLKDDRITEAVAAGYIDLDLSKGKGDPTVTEDARQLLVGGLDGIKALDFEAGHRIKLVYLGKGKTVSADSRKVKSAEARPKTEKEAPSQASAELGGMDAFNLATKNEFRLVYSKSLLSASGKYDQEHGLDRGTPIDGLPEAETGLEEIELPDGVQASISGNNDDRTRSYGFNAAVTISAHRRLVQIGGGCSGALVGPRHVVTVGHCLYDRDDSAWYDDYWVRAGANGTFEADQVFVNDDNVPSGQTVWFFTPSRFRTASNTWGYDYGILTLPARLGNTVGWFGRAHYNAQELQSAYVFRRGYPLREATFENSAGVEFDRIDEPVNSSPNHLYQNNSDCSIGEFESRDSDNWSRVMHHSCDASAGDSGSPLYAYDGGSPAVIGVHFYSECGRYVGDVACTGDWFSRPLAAIRLTPEYRDWIGTFRSTFP